MTYMDFYKLIPYLYIVIFVVGIVIFIKNVIDYRKSTYYQITKIPYFLIKYDTGRYGEYLIYKYLKEFEGNNAKFLFNVYIPKENGGTTEIDVLMICTKGIFVFESKNYSGWIFGNENQRYWYQTLPKGRGRSQKERFYNPILQNQTHIKHLKAFLNKEIPMHSIIVFSERCVLKSIHTQTGDVNIICRDNVGYVVCSIYNKLSSDILDEKAISDIYNKLYPYTQVNQTTKNAHIDEISKYK